jgi:predicted TIM-barrel fold metal-dependent hydrolase
MNDAADPRPFRGAYYRSLAEAGQRVDSVPAEAILEPLLAIVDPHHHLSDGRHGRYMVPEYLADVTLGHNIRQTVFVESSTMYRNVGPEAMRPVGEIEFAARIAARSAEAPGTQICAGIVGHAALSLGESVAEVLEAQIEAAGGRLKGVRDLVQWEGSDVGRHSSRRAPPHKLLAPAFRRGVSRLSGLGLSLDIWVFHPQLPELIDLADAFPGTQIVLDHAGTPLGVEPYRRQEVFSAWRAMLAELSKRPNVAVKIGGFGMPYNGFDFHFDAAPPRSAALAEAWGAYVAVCIESFGVDRCMFESNSPADKQTCSYGTLWNAFKRMTADYSPREKAALFANTAQRIYRLPGW